MDPVFTLQWPEFLVAQRLQKLLPKSQGYTVLIPLSRQEKAIDLAIVKKKLGRHAAVTIQIKASRTYSRPPPKRPGTKRFRFYTWFNNFPLPDDADYFILLGLYPTDPGETRTVSSTWYQDCSLLFTRIEMKSLLQNCLTVGGSTDRIFGFGFDDPRGVFLTRGDRERSFKDYSSFELERKVDVLRASLSLAEPGSL